MGKPTGFIEYKRAENPEIAELERICGYDEFHLPLGDAMRREQAMRCMACGVSYCQSDYGCPLHNLIPEWNDMLYRGNIPHALSRLLKTASFPEFTGRVCPALCENACMLNRDSEPTTVRDNELYIIEEAFRRGLMTPNPPGTRSGRRVAVVGSGPSGLAVADLLNRRGHSVTIFERDDRFGGLLMYGIPNMKLDKGIIDRRIRLMTDEGIRFESNARADAGLLKDFDATILCCGAKKPRDLRVEGRDAVGIHFAVDYLTEITRSLLSKREARVTAKGKRVVVVGGGDTGNDCVGSCIRQACRSVVQLEMMPANPTARSLSNPWPQWARVLRRDYGQREAEALWGKDPRVYLTTVKALEKDASGVLAAVVTVSLARGADGRFIEIPGSEKREEAQLLLIAAGFTGCEPDTLAAFGIQANVRGNAASLPDAHATDVPGLFVAGDMRTGQSLAVRAIADGRAAAREVDEYLMGYTNI